MKRLRFSGVSAALDPSGSVNVLQQVADILQGIQSNLSQVITEYNKEVFPVISTLPQGIEEVRWRLADDSVNARINGLDGANIFVDIDASATEDAGRFWYSSPSLSRPRTIKESLLALYTELTALADQLRIEMAAAVSSTSISAYNTSTAAGNLIDNDVDTIIFDGTTITATSVSSGIISVSSSGGGGGSGNGYQAPGIVVGNAVAGDTSNDCDYLDTGNAANLAIAIATAGASDVDIWVRPGTYDYSLSGGPSSVIAIPAGVRVYGAGVGSVLIKTRLYGDVRAFTLAHEASLEELSIQVPSLTNNADADLGIVTAIGSDTLCRKVKVEVAAQATIGYLDVNSLFAADASLGGTGTFDTCYASGPSRVISAESAIYGFLASGVLASGSLRPVAVFRNCVTSGLDGGFYGATSNPVIEGGFCEEPYVYGIRISACNQAMASGVLIQMEDTAYANAYGVYLSGSICTSIQGNTVVSNYGTNSVDGIYVTTSDHGTIVGNILKKVDNAIILTSGADYNIVSANRGRLVGVTTISDSGTGNDVSHNMLD